MEINNLYIYYNNNGQVVSRTPYYENGSIRQGSTFNLNLLFDKGFIKSGDVVLLYFKWPQMEAQDLPYVSFYDDYNEISDDLVFTPAGTKIFDKDFSKFGIQAGVEYDCFTFRSSAAIAEGFPNLTELDGNLEIGPKIIRESNLTRGVDVTTLGNARIFIERDSTYISDLKVSSVKFNEWLDSVQTLIPNQFVRDITTSPDENYHILSMQYDDEGKDIRTINLPVPSVSKEITVNEFTDKTKKQTASLSGTGELDKPLNFTFDMYKPKDGFGITAFEIGEDGNLYLYDGRSEEDQKMFKYQLNQSTGELEIIYN